MGDSDTTRPEAAEMLSALADTTSRDILEATAGDSATVSELADRCDIPTSTAYRKVERLVEAGLLVERVRIRPESRNPWEYLLCRGEITLTIDGSGALSLDYDVDGSDRPEDDAGVGEGTSTPGRISTDGGTDLEGKR